MKHYYLLLIPLAILFTGCGVTSSQTGSDNKASKKEKRAVVLSLMERQRI